MRLLLAAHGSREPAWSRVVEEIAAAVRRRARGLDVRLGYVDVQGPRLADLLAPDVAVVPLLLSRGVHAVRDIEEPAAAAGARVTAPLGPDPRLTAALTDRLAEAGAPARVPVVLAGAGSSDPAARADVATQARYLANLRATDVATAYAGGGVDPVARAVRDAGGAVAVSAYLLSSGRFSGLLEACGARWVAAPLGAHPAVIDVILARYAASGQEPVRPRING